MTFDFKCHLERYPGASAYFVCYLPTEIALEIDQVTEGLRGGFSSVRVAVTLGATTWSTSIFKDAKRASYLLLIKKAIRERFSLEPGATMRLRLELVDF
ncbi:MAG: hypothetical protein RL672_53 [Actinomycetota bacterium]|jgi:hypothetical protein